MTADSSITPSAATATATADDSGGTNSPSGRKTLPSPWVHVVRAGIEPGSINPGSNFSDPVTPTVVETAATTAEASDGNAGGTAKWVWSKPSVTSSPVMGAVSWPALSESTRTGVKSVAGSSDGSTAASQAPVISQPPPKQAKPNSNPNHNSNSNPNHRQKSIKRGGAAGGGSSYVRPPQQPPLPPPFPLFDMYGNLVPTIPEPPPPPFKPSNWSPRPVDHSFNRHPGRRNNNFGPRPYNNGYGGRREHHGPSGPSGPRSPAVSNVHVPPHQMVPPPPPPYRGFFRPPFLVPPQLRPYGAPIGYEMGAPYVYFPTLAPAPYRGGAPVLSPGPSVSTVSVTDTDASVHDEILKQIEYYFSDDNLVKDNYLRSHMDEEGWVPLTLIAGFPRMQAMTNDIQMLLNILNDSSTVEIQDEKVRRRADWKKWVHTRREVTENNTVEEEASLQMLKIEVGPSNKEQVLANGDVSNEDH